MPYLLTTYLEGSGLQYQSLFQGKTQEEIGEHAPYIVRLEDGNDFTRKLFTGAKGINGLWEKELGIFIRSRATLPELRKHFRKFTKVQDEHANDHPVYGTNGSFGKDGFLTRGLKALAEGKITDSFEIIDHEQINILEPFMYRLIRGVEDDAGVPMGKDTDFANFMNALEKANLFDNKVTGIDNFDGLWAKFSANQEHHMLLKGRLSPR